ncbi:tetratricopeptide repeat protein [Saccharopolyspora sp. NPDC050389]|uniref:tetratricopeptide repeat protein n=1 Tax=Saccharopolyspora sp. NPDC050389 TaxID=3155516 RepID=UPI0033CEDD8F
MVPQLANSFQQRTLSEELAQAVERDGASVGSQPAPGDTSGHSRHHILTGLGGGGKTQLAAQLAQRFLRQWHQPKDNHQLDLLVWITADSKEAVVNGYARAAIDVGADEQSKLKDLTAEQACQKFQAWLATTSKRWLIILDDLQNPRDLNGLWPPDTGHTVVTTRRRGESAFDGRHVIEVGLFGAQEALNYLRAKLGARGRTAEAAELAKDLGFLPLALAQAAPYIAMRNITCAEYRRRLADETRRLADVVPDHDGLPDEHRTTVAATWSLSIDAANQLSPAGLARPLLELASILDPNGIPPGVFTAPPVLQHLSAITSADTVSAEHVWDALWNLHRLSLATRDTRSGRHGLRVHALVQRATREDLSGHHTLAELTQFAADALVHIWSGHGAGAAFEQILRDNAANLADHGGQHLWSADGAHLVLFRVGRSLGITGNVSGAVTYFQHLHDQAERVLDADHTDTLIIRHCLAGWRGRAGDVAAAVAECEVVLASTLTRFGPKDPLTLAVLHNLAFFRGEAGDAAGAIVALEELLAGQLQVLGPTDPATLKTRRSLATWRAQTGDVAGAVTELEELLADQVQLFGPYHPATLTVRHELASCRGRAGDVAGAVAELEELLASQLQAFGPHHPTTLTTRHSLAFSRGEAGDVAGAVGELEEVLASQRRGLSPKDPDTMATWHSLAYFRGLAGDAAGAVAELEKLLTERNVLLGPKNPVTLTTQHSLAFFRGQAGDAAGAVRELEATLASQLQVLGPEHPDTRTTRHDLAYWQRLANDL